MPFRNKPPCYDVWRSMRDRCRNPRFKQWADYGERGITVCERWDSYANFIADMGERPPGHVIDRIDNDGNYEPANCRWASKKESQRNQRITRWVIIEGAKYRAADLADIANIKTDTIVSRAGEGLSYAEVISTKARKDIGGLALGGRANGERQRARTHCKRGHEFDPVNTYLDNKGNRQCRACHRIKVLRQRAKRALHCAP